MGKPQEKRKDNRLILLYKGLKGKPRIPTGDLIPKTRRCRNQHSMAFQLPSASVDFLCPWSIFMYIIVFKHLQSLFVNQS